jgi:hypothetical protein
VVLISELFLILQSIIPAILFRQLDCDWRVSNYKIENMRGNARHICQCCSLILHTNEAQTGFVIRTRQLLPRSRRHYSAAVSLPVASKSKPNSSKSKSQQFWGNDVTISSADNAALVHKAQSIGHAILTTQTVPVEEEVEKALELLKYAAMQLHNSTSSRVPNAVDDLLHAVSTEAVSSSQQQKASAATSTAINLLSTLAYKIMVHPPVFITPKLLDTYVEVQLALQRPSSLPEIFDLYANKSVPVPGSSPIVYKDTSPSKPTQAIPEKLADQALAAAIRNKQLTLALDIIDSTYASPAFRRNKFVRKALPTVAGLAVTPLAAVPLAQAWAETSTVADPTQLALYSWMGMLTYVFTVSGLGYCALTTYNDQMERVTWIPGTPLSQRWLREEERAAADKVALAWGFKEVSRRGEEEGEDWDLLREWCGQRSMILDATELMEGMQ